MEVVEANVLTQLVTEEKSIVINVSRANIYLLVGQAYMHVTKCLFQSSDVER